MISYTNTLINAIPLQRLSGYINSLSPTFSKEKKYTQEDVDMLFVNFELVRIYILSPNHTQDTIVIKNHEFIHLINDIYNDECKFDKTNFQGIDGLRYSKWNNIQKRYFNQLNIEIVTINSDDPNINLIKNLINHKPL